MTKGESDKECGWKYLCPDKGGWRQVIRGAEAVSVTRPFNNEVRDTYWLHLQ
jgi:hypothetical protein